MKGERKGDKEKKITIQGKQVSDEKEAKNREKRATVRVLERREEAAESVTSTFLDPPDLQNTKKRSIQVGE